MRGGGNLVGGAAGEGVGLLAVGGAAVVVPLVEPLRREVRHQQRVAGGGRGRGRLGVPGNPNPDEAYATRAFRSG